MLLPLERIKIQPIEITNERSDKSVEAKHDKHKKAEAEGHKEAEREATPAEPPAEPCTKPEEEAKEVEELEESHATEPHVEPQPKHEGSVETKDLNEEKADEELEDSPTLPNQVKEANQNDVLFTKIREYLTNLVDYDRPTDLYLCGSRAANGLLYKENKLWVTNDLRLDVIREVHN